MTVGSLQNELREAIVLAQTRNVSLLTLVTALSGCQYQTDGSKEAMTAGQTVAVSAAELTKIGLAFQNYEVTVGKPPAKAEDLQPFLKDTAVERDAYSKLRRGDVLFVWGSSSKIMPAGPASTVLAYAKDVPTNGGLV